MPRIVLGAALAAALLHAWNWAWLLLAIATVEVALEMSSDWLTIQKYRAKRIRIEQREHEIRQREQDILKARLERVREASCLECKVVFPVTPRVLDELCCLSCHSRYINPVFQPYSMAFWCYDCARTFHKQYNSFADEETEQGGVKCEMCHGTQVCFASDVNENSRKRWRRERRWRSSWKHFVEKFSVMKRGE